MPIKFSASRADFRLDVPFERPQFALFQDGSGLISHLFTALEPHGLRLSDLKVERGTGGLAEIHVLCNLFEYALTIRVWIDRVEVICLYVESEEKEKKYSAAIVDALVAIQRKIEPGFRTYAFSMNLHGPLEGESVKDYLAKFVAKTPNIGTPTGAAVGYYYGPTDERLFSSLTLDVSVAVTGGIYIRPQATWDASRVTPQDLPVRVRGFVRAALESLDLETPS